MVQTNIRDGGDGMLTTASISGPDGSWLPRALGWHGFPCDKHVVQDVYKAIQSARGRRCGGLWKGKTCTPTLQITVRGKDLEVMNTLGSLELVLDSNGTSLEWLIGELYEDFKNFSPASKKENEDAGPKLDEMDRSHDLQEDAEGDEDGNAEDEDAAWAEINKLKTSEGRVWWVPSKHAFHVKLTTQKYPETFAVSRKLQAQRPLSIYIEALKAAKCQALSFARDHAV